MDRVDEAVSALPGARPRVGVGALLWRDGRVLLGLRHGSHGADTWATPGGHLEFGESPESCAVREVLEETGLRVSPAALHHVDFTHDLFPDIGRHYITLFVEAPAPTGEPQLREPDKCLQWAWFRWDALPALALFSPMRTLVDQGYRPPIGDRVRAAK